MDSIDAMLKQLLLDYEIQLANPSRGNNLSDLLGDCFFEIGASGNIYNLDQTLKALRKASRTKTNITNFKATQISENIVNTTYLAEKTDDKGNIIKSRRKSIWQNNGGQWQMIFHEGNQID